MSHPHFEQRLLIWFPKLALLLRRKNLGRNIFVSSSHYNDWPPWKLIEPCPNLVLKWNRHKQKRMVSLETSLSFKVLHTFRKIEMCKFRSSMGTPELGLLHCWDKYRFKLKIMGPTLGIVMLELIPWTPRAQSPIVSSFCPCSPSGVLGVFLHILRF